jgi:formate C-acetyltransferase
VPRNSAIVKLACADDDAQGQSLDVFWDYELDRCILKEEGWKDLAAKGFDPPRHFAAFLHTLRWNCVTATDPNLFQAPFRAGIKIDAYQMEPLRKALHLPRVNLFIADDTGLGKTIEAGLIARELLLRKKAKTIVVATPPSVLEQWKAELEERFGLVFEILDRAYLTRMRRERGFGVNPWRTHSRFLVSHNLLIDPAYSDPLREWLGPLLPGSLLILDEAHHAAPASGGRYGIETKFTRAVRDLSGRFEHRLFLSATPHNGHSNSFSTLLELLDPYRFTRGVKVRGKKALEDVMVRRLKEDIRNAQGGFPKRQVERVPIEGLPEDAPELVLSRLLDEYRTACEERFASTSRRAQAAAGLLVVGLQQRLLSSIEAFARSLKVHRATVEKQWEKGQAATDDSVKAGDIAETLAISIGPDDFIVGRASTKAGRYGLFFPELEGGFLDKVVDIIRENKRPFVISDETAKIVREEIVPYWKGKSFHEGLYAALPEDTRNILFDPNDTINQRRIITETATYRNSLQWVPDYEKVLKRGLKGLKREAENKLANLDASDPEVAIEKIPFLEAIITICDAVAVFSKRYAALARKLAGVEHNPERRSELLEIASVCEWVPENPARTFHEAAQSYWMVSVFKRLEEKTGAVVSNGRMDQYLYPFYKKDMEAGRLTEESTLAILENIWLNMAQYLDLFVSPTFIAYNEGFTHWETVTIGGKTPDGRDASNELSYLILKSKREFPLNYPDLAARIHALTPDRFLREICETIKEGSGFPKLLNDEEIVPLLLAKGAKLHEANDYAGSGCTEVRIPNIDTYTSPCAWVNLAAVLEMTLYNGKMKKFGSEQLGARTGDALGFATYEDFWQAFCVQMQYILTHTFRSQYVIDKLRGKYVATPLSSALHDLCMASCKDLHRGDVPGGTKLGFYDVIGFATVIDSVAAIKKLVYEENKITMGELIDAMQNNFEGRESLRQRLLNAPKYGNNDPYADSIGRQIDEQAVKFNSQYKSAFGAELDVRYVPLTSHIPLGKIVSATPNGRKAWEYLSEGSSASHGADVKGPTAVLISNANTKEMLYKEHAARLLNLKLTPATVAGPEGTRKLMSLIRTFCDLKLWHLQFNIINRATLLAAQTQPEKYRNLLVRVAGYSAYFVDLSPELQNEIIARTEHTC